MPFKSTNTSSQPHTSLGELDQTDKEIAQQLRGADQMPASARLDDIQERGIDSSSNDSMGHIDNVFFNHKVVQSPRHTLRDAMWAGLLILVVGYFILWALGIFLLPGISF